MEGNTLNSEIFNSFPVKEERMTASAFVQQKANLKPEALKDLLFAFNDMFQSFKNLKNLRVFAIDGSDFCTPCNKDSNAHFGFQEVNQTQKSLI